MKGNNISIILVSLLLFGELLLVQHSFAQTPAGAVQSNPLNINYAYPDHGPGETFTVYADVVNVTNLFRFQMGFYFDENAVQVLSVAEGGFLSNDGHDTLLPSPGTIDNANGVVTAYGWSLTDTTKAKTGTGHLIKVQMKVNSALWPPYTGTYPGSPAQMMHLTDADGDPAELILIFSDGVTEITPLPQNIHDGMFTLSVTPANPLAAFTFVPVPSYAGEPVYFDASGSTRGWNGYAWGDIVDYAWDWNDGNPVQHVATATVDHTFATPNTFHVTLLVTDVDGKTSAPTTRDVRVIARTSDPVIDLQSQRLGYADPTYWINPFFGEGPYFPCDSFRPADHVQLFALATYNDNPVPGQLIAYEVQDNQGNWVLAGLAQTNASGWAMYEFEIPWPCTGVENEFGIWKAVADWTIGELDGKPFEKTINDTMNFQVSWGLWIASVATDKNAYFKSELVVVKVTIQNDYLTPVQGTLTANIYDDLLVPINTPAILADYTFPVGISHYDLPGIHLEKWAFVGIGTAKANMFTKLPFLGGTAFCPEQVTTFVIKKTFNPPIP